MSEQQAFRYSARPRASAAVVALCAALFARPALAVDGEILINQASVNAGSITPGDAPGFPATLSRPGRYKLTGNLRVPAGQHGIQVTAQNVTIDLNGFTISSNPPGEAETGVLAPYVTGLRVVNGTIFGMSFYAIYNQEGRLAVVEDMRLVSNGIGVYAPVSRIRNSTIANGTTGISGCLGCLIENNLVTGNTSGGIAVSRATVLGNVIVGNFRGLISGEKTGYGNNILFDNGAQVLGDAVQLHPNICEPACP